MGSWDISFFLSPSLPTPLYGWLSYVGQSNENIGNGGRFQKFPTRLVCSCN